MKYLRTFFILAFTLCSYFAQAHDYHTSLTDIRYNPRSQSLEVAVKVFTDDLENALSQRNKTKISYSNSDKVSQYLENYLQATLAFEVTRGKPLKYKMLGSEEDADMVWIYVEVPVGAGSLPQLYVKNTVLTEVFDDQMNIVNINYKGKTESVLMQKDDAFKKLELR